MRFPALFCDCAPEVRTLVPAAVYLTLRLATGKEAPRLAKADVVKVVKVPPTRPPPPATAAPPPAPGTRGLIV